MKNNLKVIVVGDLHLDSRPPASRSEDYEEQMFGKLEQIDEIARSRKIATVIQTGDVFNRRSISTQFLCRVMRHFKNSPVDYYAIAGNHDLPYGNEKYLNRSPLSVLFSSGALKDLTKQNTLENVNFRAYHFSTDLEIEDPKDSQKMDVLVTHQYWDDYPNAENETIDKDQARKYDFVISGHEHDTLRPEENILFPGSIARMTAGHNDMERDVCVFEVCFKPDIFVEKIELDVKPIEEAYDMNKIEKSNQKKELDDFVSSIDQSDHKGGIDIRDLLTELVEDDSIKAICEEYLREKSII